MVIVHNPTSGATISDKFKGGGFSLAKPLEPNSLQYCEPALAEALVATYHFLQIITPAEAQSIKEAQEKPTGELKCDKCEFITNHQIALISHQKKHQESVESKLNIPVVETIKAEPVKQIEKTDEIPDDLKGVGWYGEGVKEENGSSS